MVGLDSALGIANGGLNSISAALALISQNVANGSTPAYAVEVSNPQSVDAGGEPSGVNIGVATLATDEALQVQVNSANAQSAGASVTSAALANIEPALGTVANGDDLGSYLAALQNSFSSLLNDPSSQPDQDAVVNAAATLAQGINTLSETYNQTRQSAQNDLVTEVGQLNDALGQVGLLNNQIVALQAQGQSTADLQNQRNAVTATISQLVDARFVEQPNGALTVLTSGGAQLPTDTPDPLSIASATTGPSVFYPGGGLPGIELDGSDVTAQFYGGQIGANVTLRDSTIPTYQGELDEFSHTLASRFDAQGLTLFTDPSGVLPQSTTTPAQSGYVGFASTIEVNPLVTATPSLVRDGTRSVLAGDPGGGAPFTPNPDGLAGFTGLIDNVLTYTFGDESQAGETQPAPATTGLGPSGTLAAPFAAPAALSDFATALTGSQAEDSANATTDSTDTAAVQTALQNKLTAQTGVSLDTEMSDMIALQNAYAANAKIISGVQSLLADVFAAVQ
jgi:flagellar hook-associated protein 1 FlgK